MKIAVTGGSGKAGRVVVQDLLEHGHDVINVDRVFRTNITSAYTVSQLRRGWA